MIQIKTMGNSRKDINKTGKVLAWLCAGLEVLDNFIVTPVELRKRAFRGNLFKSTRNFNSFYDYLIRRGYIYLVDKNNEKFVKLTKKGQLRTLLEKSKISKSEKWDGKWRVIIFDIPEESSALRDRFRKLLKTYGFVKLQDSVFIYPYALNREALAYLKETGLMSYIRILKVEEMDDDKDLKKLFGLFK